MGRRMDREKVGGVEKMKDRSVAKYGGESALRAQKRFLRHALGDMGQVRHLLGHGFLL